MKAILRTLAVAAALAMPVVGQAQAFDNDVDVQLKDHVYKTTGTPYGGVGGGFLADFTLEYPAPGGSKAFSDYLLWCIDPDRTVDVPGSYSYSAWTAEAFANDLALGSTNPARDLSIGEMRSIASLVFTLQNNWNVFDDQQRNDYQQSIWATFRGEAPVYAGDATTDLKDWVVLYGNEGNQTFLMYVPEPADSALIIVGIAGLSMMMMRRRRA